MDLKYWLQYIHRNDAVTALFAVELFKKCLALVFCDSWLDASPNEKSELKQLYKLHSSFCEGIFKLLQKTLGKQ